MRLGKIIFTISVTIILIAIGYTLYLLAPTSFLSTSTSLSDEKVRFVIPLESKQEDIISRLTTEEFIRSEKLFTFLTGLIRYPGAIEPGAYLLSRRMTLLEIANTLLYKPYQKWIVLVPGLRKEQVAQRLEKKFAWSEDKTKEFLDNASEGYLFPDTYLLNIEEEGKDMAKRLISNFNEKFDGQMQKDLLAQNVRMDTAVKIASLIERESGSDEDKPLIAGIIWNRLNKGMKLQIDATTQYITGTKDNWWKRVDPKEHKIDSPYNTYIYKGLPPTAIANPSLASLQAAVYPKDSDCFYYLHDHGKNIHCSKTYEEHLENIEKYLLY